MARLPILIAPDPRLKRRAEPVGRADRELARLAGDMVETMHDADGIGLAAPQVGVLRRVIVVDAGARAGKRAPLVMVNPEVVSAGGEEAVSEEGCLSLPGQFAEVSRPSLATVRYLDAKGRAHRRELSGLEAVCVQHEIDHLEGVLFVDRIGRFRRDRIIERLVRMKRQARQGQAPSDAQEAA